MEHSPHEDRPWSFAKGPARRWMAAAILCAGFGILLYLLAAASDSGIPEWQPVNGALHAKLSGDGEPAANPALSSVPGSASSPVSGSIPDLDLNPAPGYPAPADAKRQLPAQPTPDTNASGAGLLDLNTATAAQLVDLPGIGPAKAQAILAHRKSRGGFQAVEDLLQVKGIGPKIYEQIAPLVTIGR